MNRTVNYDLCQYEADDKTSYLVNYNNDMLKIDTAIKAADDAADAAQAKADTADGKADINAGSISTLNTQINGAQGLAADVSALEGSVNTINSLIGNGEPTTQDKTLIGAINELAAEMPSPTTQLPATSVSYSNTTSGLSATNAQAAIDEVVSMLPQGGVDADDVDYDNTASGLTATNVQDAIDELATATPEGARGAKVDIRSYATTSNKYTCPADGIIYIRSAASGNIQLYYEAKDSSAYDFDMVVTASSVAPYVETAVLPVFKGDRVYLESAVSSTGGQVSFYPNV